MVAPRQRESEGRREAKSSTLEAPRAAGAAEGAAMSRWQEASVRWRGKMETRIREEPRRSSRGRRRSPARQ